jgi:hypothetical protein
MMYRQLTVAAVALLLTCGLSASAEDQDAPEAKPMLEGVLKVYPKFLYKYYLVADGGQTCALYEPEQRTGELLSRIEPGSRVRVSGSLGTRLHPGGTKDNPSPFGRTWVIYMDVEKVEILPAARAEG